MKNKKGNLPIIILVLGVLAVCGLALLSFYASNLKISNNFSGIKLIEKINSQIEENNYLGKPIQDLSEQKNVTAFNFKDGFLKQKTIFSITYNPPV